MSYIERKRTIIDNQVKAMEVDNCEAQDPQSYNEAWESSWEEWPTNEREEINYMGKGGGWKGKGKGKNKGWGKGFNQFVNYQGKGKGENQGKGEKGAAPYEKGKGKGKGFQGQCYWCGEWGHSQNNCASKDAYMSYMRAYKGGGKGQEVHNVEETNPGSGTGQ